VWWVRAYVCENVGKRKKKEREKEREESRDG